MLLRRATQISNRITRETVFEADSDPDEYYGRRRRKTPTLKVEASVNIDGNPTQRINGLRNNLLDRYKRMSRLMDIGTRIRQKAGEKQAECGVNSLVTERVTLIKKQHIIEYLLGSPTAQLYDETEFRAQVDAMRDRLSRSTSNQGAAEITVRLLTEQDRDNLRAEAGRIKRRLLDIDDKLAELNSTNSIEISDEDQQYLQAEGIA
jgi:hypothetical protein